MTPLRLATRRSALAMAQSTLIAERLHEVTGRTVQLVPVVSEGDRNASSLREIGGVGVFVAAVRAAVVSGDADLAVHSLKDLPTAPHPDLILAAVPTRADVRDAVVAREGGLADLPHGARVGTGAPRRAAQLAQLRPDLTVVDIRGNVDTRIGYVEGGELAAVLLAMAGLQRLGRADRATEVLSADQMMPAPGQGALAVEARGDDRATVAAVAMLDDAPTRAAVTAERALLARLEAGCTAPVGALATVVADQIFLQGIVFGEDGSGGVRVALAGAVTDPTALGHAAAEQLLAGAEPLLGGTV